MTKILALAGAKSSGKSTACNVVLGWELSSLGLIDDFNIAEDGKLLIHEAGQPPNQFVLMDTFTNNPEVRAWLDEKVHPYVKIYSFGDAIKQLCVNLLGIEHKLIHGSEADKNTLTHLRWEDMPGIATEETLSIGYADIGYKHFKLEYHPPDPMTIREVMQYVGTNIFRRMYAPVWINACMNQIQAEGSQFALISDVRFTDETNAVRDAGGKVISLTRAPYAHLDKHESENGLIGAVFDHVIDNKNVPIDSMSRELYAKLREWGFLEYEIMFGES